MRARLVGLLLAGCAAALGQTNFVWDYPTNQYPPPTPFTGNGDTSFTSSAGGSWIYTPTVSGVNGNDYEMRTVLSATQSLAGGTYMHFLRASLNAAPGVGSYISVEFALPSNWQSGGAAQLTVNQCVNGTITQLAATSAPIHNGDTLRSVVWGGGVWIFVNNVRYANPVIPLTTGQPGYGGYNNPAGWLASPWVGHHDVVAPLTVQPQTVATSVLPTSVSLKWQGVADDPVGIGVLLYWVYRNGTALNKVTEPAFTDATVQPSTTYTYQIFARDFHGNMAATSPTFSITTPPAAAIDPRRTGIYTTGSYWGGGGEQIDTLSGNLNFSLPLATAVGRAGTKIPVGLVYNSQNWRQDNGVNWNLGYDVGFGYGWQMLIGSITPYYVDFLGDVDHYVYTDATGAQYLLNVNTSGVWSSKQSVYVWFDSNANKLHFRDGSFWVMGCTSGGTEADAGTLYPTIIEDVSGNQITVKYYAGVGLASTATNTSSRIYLLYDPRSTGPTYSYYYNADSPVPHLTYAYNSLGSSESYAFTYTTAALAPPFGSDPTYAGLTTAHLSSMAQLNQTWYVTSPFSYQFGYDSAGAGELTSVIFPYGGELSWNYTSFTYSGGRALREVGTRYLAADSQHATTWTYPITRPDAPNSVTVHSAMTLADASGIGAKTWNFTNSGSNAWQLGLVSQFVQSATVSGTVLKNDTYTWSQDPAGNPYISAKSSTSDPGSSNPQSALSTQTLDQYGNVTQSALYPYNNTTTPIKTFVNTYLNSSTYTSNYIFNRLVSSVLTPAGGSAITLVTNTYDSTTNCYFALNYSPPAQCGGLMYPAGGGPTSGVDPSPPIPLGQRGYLSYSITPAKTTALAIYTYGSPALVWGSDGQTTLASADASTNYAAPVTITSQSYRQTLAYNPWLAVTQATGANGEQVAMGYDIWGRPGGGTSPYGAGVSIGYSTSLPFTQTSTGPDGVTTTTLDGLGRAILVARGDTSGVHSYTATTYAPCACSPLAKIQKTSQPYAYGSSASAWTTYTYDGLGRPLTVQQPDGASTTHYAYLGNVTTVTDPAGKWKQFTTDVSGNLTTVIEPDPANAPSGTLTTTYTYDWMNHVTGVSMPRAGTTQTRSFVYDSVGRLTSAANPENGTVSYVYNTDNTLHYKTDAKGQQTVYSYDSLKRTTMTQYFPQGQSGAEDGCQRVTYSYDTNPINSGFSQNSFGRLTAIQYGAPLVFSSGFCVSGEWMNYFSEPGTSGTMNNFAEMYSYHPAGAVTAKQLALTRTWIWTWGGTNSENTNVEVDYTYDSAGRVATTKYPMAVPFVSSSGYPNTLGPVTLTYGYDSMGRPNALTDNSGITGTAAGWTGPVNWVQNGQYDYAGRMTSMQYFTGFSYYAPLNVQIQTMDQESMSYNVNGQLTSLAWVWNGYGVYGNYYGPSAGYQYNYSATQNNGQITQTVYTASGETISYQYDAWKRLTSASSTAPYAQTFQYDGFGNLTAKVLNGTTTPIPVNAATNQLSNASYDLNGNMTSGSGATLVYDEANRISSAAEVSGGIEYYGYTADNKRFYKYTTAGTEQMTFYGAYGEKLGVYSTAFSNSPWGLYIYPVTTNIYFAGKMILESNWGSSQDRLGSTMGRYYPYGEEITSTANDHVKFATYTRDSYTGFDYADQRFYASSYGRFNTADPFRGSAKAGDPGSWNRYSYALGDPVNGNDPQGLCTDYCDASLEDDDIAGGGGDGGLEDVSVTIGDDGSVAFGIDVTTISVDVSAPGDSTGSGDGGDSFPGEEDPVLDPEPVPTFTVTTTVNSCVAQAAAFGSVIGAGVGGTVFGTAGGALGAVGGTALEPGGGTVVLGVAGFEVGEAAGTGLGTLVGGAAGAFFGNIFCREHTSNPTPSNRPKHQKGQGRLGKSRGLPTHPKYPPRKPPPGWKGGPWNPKNPPPGSPWNPGRG